MTDILDFSANINPFGPPPELKEILDRSWNEIARYPDPDSTRLREKLARWHGVETVNIVAGNGASELICWIPRLFPRPKAVVFSPTFSEYEAAVQASGGMVQHVIAAESNGFDHDLLRYLPAPAPHLIFIGNPNNPTGNLISKPRLIAWIERTRIQCPDAVFVVDESFLPFTGNDEGISLIPLAVNLPRVIILRSLTKILSIPGLRLGYAVAHPGLAEHLKGLLPAWRINIIAQKFGEAIFDCSQFLANSVAAIKKAREELARELSGSFPIRVYESAANFILIKLNEEDKASAIAHRLAMKGILVRQCDDFVGLDKDRYLRIAVRKPEENRYFLSQLKELIRHDG